MVLAKSAADNAGHLAFFGTVDDALLPFVPDDFVDILPSICKILPQPFFADARRQRKDKFGSLYARGVCLTDFGGDEERFIPRDGILVELRSAVVRNVAEEGAVVAPFGETVRKCPKEAAEEGEFGTAICGGVFAPMEALRVSHEIVRRAGNVSCGGGMDAERLAHIRSEMRIAGNVQKFR